MCRPPADFCCAGPCTGRAPCLSATSKTPSILSCQVELKQPISSYRLQTLLTIVTNTVHMSWVIFASLDFILLVENENSICPFFIHNVMAIFNRSELFNKCNWAKITSYNEDYIQLWMLCSISVLNLWFVCVICNNSWNLMKYSQIHFCAFHFLMMHYWLTYERIFFFINKTPYFFYYQVLYSIFSLYTHSCILLFD